VCNDPLVRRSRGTLAIATVFLVAVTAGAAAGSPTSDDVSLGIQAFNTTDLLHPTTTPGTKFKLAFAVDTAGGVSQVVVVRVGLPDGLRWGVDGPDPGEGCTGTAPAVCRQALLTNGAGTVEGGYIWDVIADHLGTYDVTATVEPEQPDPNRANNTATLHFEVVGGSTGGQGGDTSRATASAVKLSPTRPRAGSTVVASVRVTKGGSAVRPTRVRCAASMGAVKVKGTARAASGVASCLFKTPRGGAGKRLTGSVSFSAGGASFTRRFAAKLS
jgi:hypothetical protein